MMASGAVPSEMLVESAYAWRRLAASLALSTIGGVGLWSVVVVLPAVQAEFGVARGGASLPYTATMLGFAVGGVLMGRLADRFGIVPPLVLGRRSPSASATSLPRGRASLGQFALTQGLLIGMFGSSVTFGPLVADVSHWFSRRRGIAVSIVRQRQLPGRHASGRRSSSTSPRRWAGGRRMVGVGVFCAADHAAARPSRFAGARRSAHGAPAPRRSPPPMPAARVFARRVCRRCSWSRASACCVAMSMPQVHIVAYCGDLGYGVGARRRDAVRDARPGRRQPAGLGLDRRPDRRRRARCSWARRCSAWRSLLYLPFDGLVSLYVVSALFGLSQGGIVPSYAIIVREYFPPARPGARIGRVLMATVVGMALGGWMSGAIFDLTGSYHAAFLNGIAWNVLNLAIALWLLGQPRRIPAIA